MTDPKPNKKLRRSHAEEIADEIRRLPVPRISFDYDEVQAIVDGILAGLRPGAGILGTKEEEQKYAKMQQVNIEDAGEDRPIDGLSRDGGQAEHKGGNRKDADGQDNIMRERDANSTSMVILPFEKWEIMPVFQYYGSEWAQMIIDLHSVPPLTAFDHLSTTPHDYQLKGAAQIDFLCKGPFRGCLIGDPMGLGKTFQAILSMKAIQHEPGLVIVACPANLCRQWVSEIHAAFDQGHGLLALHLKDPKISAHQILAGGYDVVVASFEFIDANISKVDKFKKSLNNYRTQGNREVPLPKRPTAALASGIWKLLGLPFKRVYIDEAQYIKKREGQRHQAVRKLPAKSFCVMSGTLAHNRWHDLSGHLDFIQGHPYTTDELFHRQFSKSTIVTAKQNTLLGPERALLQRLLQAFTIIRPRDIIKLPPCERIELPVKLAHHRACVVLDMTEQYKKRCWMNQNQISTGVLQRDEDASALGIAVVAQMYSLHPRLAHAERDAPLEVDNEDLANTTADHLNEEFIEKSDPNAVEKRKKWLAEVKEWDADTFGMSPHLLALAEIMNALIKHHPKKKIVVLSQYLKYLDIIDIYLKKTYKISSLRYDGSVPQHRRVTIQQEFADPKKASPLLMTVGAGAVGLNLTSGKIVILAEEWWNSSVESQAVCRCWRQGQTERVLVVKLRIQNSAIEAEIARVRHSKAKTNRELMAPLIHKHDEMPKVVDLV